MLLLILFHPVLCGSSVWTRPFYESAYKTPTNVIYVPQSSLYGNPDTSRIQLVAVPQFGELSPNIQIVGDTLIAEPGQLALGGGYDPYGRRMHRRRYGVQPPRAVMRSNRAMVQMSGMQSGSQTDTESSNRMNTELPADAESSNMGAPNTENGVNHENEQTNMFTPAPDSMLTPSPDSQRGGDSEMTYQIRNETEPEQPPLDVELQGPQSQRLKCSVF